MAQSNISNDKAGPAQTIYPDLYVADERAFIAAVHEGIASLEDGPTVDHATVLTELHQTIHGKV